MDAVRSGEQSSAPGFDGLRAEASAAVTSSANALRATRERYREAYAESLRRWQALRDEAELLQATAPRDADGLRNEVDALSAELGLRQIELSKLDLAQRTLERTWLFLEQGDASLLAEDGPPTVGDMAMRIMEAQEAERSRLAQEVHDGPAQALANAIFQVDYLERIVETDPPLAHTELRYLRDLLRRELGDVRSFISQLHPPRLDEIGLNGSIVETVDHMRTLTGLPITASLDAPEHTLGSSMQTVVLRVVQEALQNVRKHAAASTASVATRIEGADWVVEVRDDGRGFDPGAIAARGRRSYGLEFMRERAELIGAKLDVRSRPDDGTVVRLAIPTPG